MSEEKIKWLREDIRDICQYKELQEELTYDIPIEILKNICVALDYLQQENENLKAQIDLHCGVLKREHEAIKRLSKLEEESAKLLKQNEFLMKDSNTLQNLEMYLENMWNETQDIWFIKIINKIKEFKEEKED